MRFSVLGFVCLVVFVATAALVVHGRLMMQLDNIPANRVNTIRTFVSNQYDKTNLFGSDSIELTFETKDNVISCWLSLDFVVSNKAAQVFTALTNRNWENGIVGRITIHQCAIDRTNSWPYYPCNDERTWYIEKRIP